ncbi:MAG TPA: type II secretion system protein [Elusimicrobiales bacterium]|nr:type II secretion system protein [Elusimicrobiales bacterium]
MSSSRKGFTLIELMVVIIILSIMTSIGVPYYIKTVESSKALDAVAMSNMISSATRMIIADNPSLTYNGGLLTSAGSCQTGACSTGGTRDACDLVRCRYLAAQNWDNLPYIYRSCNPVSGAGGSGCSAGLTASARRRAGTYSAWGYTISSIGACTPVSGAPTCPSF